MGILNPEKESDSRKVPLNLVLPKETVTERLEPPKPPYERPSEGQNFDMAGTVLANLDLSPLFTEPSPTGILARYIPWISLVINLILMILILFKK